MNFPVCSETEASSIAGAQHEVSVEIETEDRGASGNCASLEGYHEVEPGEPQFRQSIQLSAVQREDPGIRLPPGSGVDLSRSVIRKCSRSSPERSASRPGKHGLSHSGLPCVRYGQSSQEQKKQSAQGEGKIYTGRRSGAAHGFLFHRHRAGACVTPCVKNFLLSGRLPGLDSHTPLFRPPETEQACSGMSKSLIRRHKNPHPITKEHVLFHDAFSSLFDGVDCRAASFLAVFFAGAGRCTGIQLCGFGQLQYADGLRFRIS